MTTKENKLEKSKGHSLEVIIITTGGTIDKSYDEFDGSLSNRETQLKNLILSGLRLPNTYLHIFSVMSKDSLFMTDYDRTLLVKTIQKQMAKNQPIVVLHGTDSMAKSAEFCFKEIQNPNVPVIFTGAMKPMGFQDSDAKQNVTEALLAAGLVAPGFYISFHNKVFTVPGVTKNIEKGTFEALGKNGKPI
ncbi:MAG: asparaginase [Halobacteriovoraceae bacterium]|jgi:L-asparaginase|nr:asparaginase [Halobacteriovoraceae bacterium]MBT5094545.1 asparaginase [Halobacteriovoraceae bacterium]